MQESEMIFDDQRIDRFVDGEMSTADEKQFLNDAQSFPKNWERIALAFVEARRFGDDLSCLVAEPQDVPTSISQIESQQSASRIGWIASIVASIALALFAGYQIHSIQNSSNQSLAHSESKPLDEKLTENKIPAVRSQAEVAWVILPDPQSDQTITVKAPIINSDQINEEWIANAQEFGVLQDGLPESIRDSLLEVGYTIHQERNLYPIPLGNGKTAIVPIDSIEVLRSSDDLYVIQ